MRSWLERGWRSESHFGCRWRNYEGQQILSALSVVQKPCMNTTSVSTIYDQLNDSFFHSIQAPIGRHTSMNIVAHPIRRTLELRVVSQAFLSRHMSIDRVRVVL